jgi:hypothetical protein
MAQIHVSKDPPAQTAVSLGYEMVASFDNRAKLIFFSYRLYAFTEQRAPTETCVLNIPREFKGSLFLARTLIRLDRAYLTPSLFSATKWTRIPFSLSPPVVGIDLSLLPPSFIHKGYFPTLLGGDMLISVNIGIPLKPMWPN